MRRACFGLVLAAGLAAPLPASAADNTVVGVGTGAVAGALVGGPIGAVVGAVAGGYIGANSPGARPRRHRRARTGYRRSVERPTVPRARLADGEPVATPVAAPVRRPSSEISTGTPARPDTTGSTRRPAPSGWQDPH